MLSPANEISPCGLNSLRSSAEWGLWVAGNPSWGRNRTTSGKGLEHTFMDPAEQVKQSNSRRSFYMVCDSCITVSHKHGCLCLVIHSFHGSHWWQPRASLVAVRVFWFDRQKEFSTNTPHGLRTNIAKQHGKKCEPPGIERTNMLLSSCFLCLFTDVSTGFWSELRTSRSWLVFWGDGWGLLKWGASAQKSSLYKCVKPVTCLIVPHIYIYVYTCIYIYIYIQICLHM